MNTNMKIMLKLIHFHEKHFEKNLKNDQDNDDECLVNHFKALAAFFFINKKKYKVSSLITTD